MCEKSVDLNWHAESVRNQIELSDLAHWMQHLLHVQNDASDTHENSKYEHFATVHREPIMKYHLLLFPINTPIWCCVRRALRFCSFLLSQNTSQCIGRISSGKKSHAIRLYVEMGSKLNEEKQKKKRLKTTEWNCGQNKKRLYTVYSAHSWYCFINALREIRWDHKTNDMYRTAVERNKTKHKKRLSKQAQNGSSVKIGSGWLREKEEKTLTNGENDVQTLTHACKCLINEFVFYTPYKSETNKTIDYLEWALPFHRCCVVLCN